MTRLAITADLHCDDFGSKVDPATGLNARWMDTVAMARWIAEDATKRQCDVLIVGGDFTEQRHPAPWRVAQIGAALSEFRGPFALYVRGNHDGLRGGRSIVDLLEAQIANRDITEYGIAIGFNQPDVRLVHDVAIAVIPYLDRHNLRAVAGFETVPDAELSRVLGEAYLTIARGLYARAKTTDAKSTVLVVHQALAGGLMSDTQAAFLGDQGLVVDTRALAAIGFEAVLAGHFHKHQVLSTDPLVAYAGSPYRTDFGEEHQVKGYLVVDVEPGKAAMEFVETPARRFVTLSGPEIEAGVTAGQVDGAIVRVRDLDPLWDAAALRRELEDAGAFEVQEIRSRPAERPDVAGGMAEGLTASEALEQYFLADPSIDDHEAAVLVERGRQVLAEVAA